MAKIFTTNLLNKNIQIFVKEFNYDEQFLQISLVSSSERNKWMESLEMILYVHLQDTYNSH